jgi:hypothetical protein
MNGAGTMAWHQSEIAQATHWDEQVLALAREVGDRKAEAFTLNNLAGRDLAVGDYDRGIARLEESLALAREAEEPEPLVLAMHNLAHATWLHGEAVLATERFAAALSVARELGVPWLVPTILVGLERVMDFAQRR